MLILGLLAFLQTTFIPGYILLNYAGHRFGLEAGSEGSRLRRLVYGFGLSQLVNYLLVFLSVSLGIYKPVTLYVVLLVEAVLIVELFRKQPKGSFSLDLKGWVSAIERHTAANSPGYNLLLVLSAAVLALYVFYFFYFLGLVFEHWDPVVGWNRFAIDWANNRIPVNTWRYPQLVPSNWSISYVLVGTTGVQCFAKAVMPLFSIGTLLLFLERALVTRQKTYLLGLVLFGGILGYLYEPSFMASGYVDIAVSFYAFLSFHAMTAGHRHSHGSKTGENRFNEILTAVLFASAAAVTKQAGIYILVVVLVWAALRMLKQCRERGKPGNAGYRKMMGLYMILLLVAGVVAGSWYALKEYHIRTGTDRSEIQMVQKANRQQGYGERLGDALNRISTHRHPRLKYVVYIGVLLLLLGLFHRKSRPAALAVAIPYGLAWALFFSYDMRNLSLALPFMAYSAAFGAEVLENRLWKPLLRRLPPINIPAAVLAAVLIVIPVLLNFTFLDSETVTRQQTRLRKEIGDKELNGLLYRYHKKEGITGKIVTNYQYLKYLPGLEAFYMYRSGRVSVGFLESLDKPEGKEIHYLLLPAILKSETDVMRRYREMVEQGRLKQVFRCRGYRFIKVIR
jgi:hypothetical protein